MKLITKKLSDIQPYPNNPRKNNGAVDAVVESIQQCGYVAPIIVDENGVILAGHTRYKALKKLGRTEAEIVVKSGLTEEQKRKYRLLDNKTGELAAWDCDLLAEELSGLDFGGFDFDFCVIQDNGYSEDFSLPEGERETGCVMTFSLSMEQKEAIESAILDMKKTSEYKQYKSDNENSNGNALYLLVLRGWNR